jgi:hypothetical protein
MTRAERLQRRDLIVHRHGDEVLEDRALPGAAAIRRAAVIGAHDDEAGVGVPLIHHVAVARVDDHHRVRSAVDLQQHRIALLGVECARPRDRRVVLAAGDVDGLERRRRFELRSLGDGRELVAA